MNSHCNQESKLPISIEIDLKTKMRQIVDDMIAKLDTGGQHFVEMVVEKFIKWHESLNGSRLASGV